MATVRCGRCQADNHPDLTGAFCQQCGALLAGSTASGGPAASVTLQPARIASPQTELRHELIALRDKQRFARNSMAALLFALAGLQLVCGLVDIIANAELTKGMDADWRKLVLAVLLAIMFGTALALAGLGWLALYEPLPAALTGLIIWALVSVMTMVLAPDALCRVAMINGPLLVALGQGVYSSYHAFHAQPIVKDSDLR